MICASTVAYSFRVSYERALTLALFFSPWTALELNLGISLSISQIIMLTIFLRLFILNGLSLGNALGLNILITLALGVLVGLMVSLGRTDWLTTLLRSGTVAVSFLIAAAGFFFATKIRLVSINTLIRTIVYSGVILSGLGIIQFTAFALIGIDIFPLNFFLNEGSDRSAVLTTVYGEFLRISSLTKEPKSLGMFSALCLSTVLFYWKLFRHRFFFLIVFSATTLMTASTSAFFIVAIAPIIIALKKFRVPIGRTLYFSAFFLSAIFTTLYVSSNDLVPYHLRFENMISFNEIIYARTIGRFEVEDTDFVIMNSMLDTPIYFATGKGVGLSHLQTENYVPDLHFNYLRDYLIAPKSGAVFLLANFGIIGAVLFVSTLSSISTQLRALARHTPTLEGVHKLIYLLFFIFISFLLRAYLLEFAMIVFGYAYLVSRQTVLLQKFTEEKHVLNQRSSWRP